MANDIIDINVYETVETVAITVNPNLTTININQVTGGGGSFTNLSTTQTASNFTINSDTGDDAVVPLGNGTLAGGTLNNYTTAEKNKLAAITGTNTGDQNLQSVTNLGNTIVLPSNKNRGIDITLPDLQNQYSNGIRVTLEPQTGTYSSNDAFVAIINGQNPNTLPYRVFGFYAITTGADNQSFVSEHNAGTISSEHYIASNASGITSNFASFFTNNVNVFNVDYLGNATASKFIKQGGTSSQFLKADGSVDSTSYTTAQNLQQVTNIGASTTNPIYVSTTSASSAITGQSGTGTGVLGVSDGGTGIDGSSNTGIGVSGYSETGVAALFNTDSVSANIANFKKSGSIVASVTNNGNINANAFVKSGGTSTQFLMADGSVSTGSTGGGISNATAIGTDTYTATISGVASYVDGAAFLVRFTNGNTTNATLNINGLGAIALYRNNDGPLIGGDIQNGGEMLCVYNSTITAFQCIGTSPNDIISYVTNADSVTITKGMPVYAFGGTGDRMTVKRAYNTLDSSSAQTVGIVMSTSIAAGQKGIIITQGLLDGLSILPTSTFADGDTIYLGATAGTITNVKPYAPNHLVYLGVVTTASAGAAGRMYVKVQNGYELDELHNVQAQNPTLKDTLWYDNTVSPAQWKTASIPTILGYTPVQSNTAITGATNTKITYDSKGLVTSGTAATTADIADSTNKRYVTDANLVVIGNTSGTNTGDQNLSGYALLASPTFTGTPSLPTGTTGTTQTPLNNSTRLATTAYVEAACAVVAGASGVQVSSQDTFGTNKIATVTAAQYAAFVTAGTVSATTLYFITA